MSGEQPPRDGYRCDRPEEKHHRADHDPFSSSRRLASFKFLKFFGQGTAALPKQILAQLRDQFVR